MRVSPATAIGCLSPEANASASPIHLSGKFAEWFWKLTRQRFVGRLIQQFSQFAIVVELQLEQPTICGRFGIDLSWLACKPIVDGDNFTSYRL